MHISMYSRRKQRAGYRQIHFHPKGFERTSGSGKVFGLIVVIIISIACYFAFKSLQDIPM